MPQDKDTIQIERKAVIDWLVEHFPRAFFRKYNQVKPLQIGIFNDILAFYDRFSPPPFSKKILREGVRYYSSSKAYLRVQQKGAARVDLYGNDVDIVTEEQARHAHLRHQTRYQKKDILDSSQE